MRCFANLLTIVLLFGITNVVFGQASTTPRINLSETHLSNGLRVITVEDRTAPVIVVAITYNVGSRDERPRRTGFAHLFEHMMFKGSENVGTGEFYYLVFNNGGNMNGSTTEDRTNYYEMLPASQLDLALFLEADRMRSLVINKTNLDNQRNAVQEERRLNLDNQPYGPSSEILQGMIYDNFAYKHSVIGSMADLNAATVDDVAAFFKTYYAPNNAVLTLVGDFKTTDALKRIRQRFGSIPRQPDPPAVDMTEPEQKAERRGTVDDPLARLAVVDIAFKTVAGNTPEFYALQILSASLQGGQSSRLYQRLVRDNQLAANVSGLMDEKRGLGALYISATLRQGVKPADVEAVIYNEIERIKKEGIANWELQKAKNTTRRSFINSLQSPLSVALNIGIWTVFYNDSNLINTRLDKVTAVTKADVQRVAIQYLTTTRRTVIVTMPKPKAAGAPASSNGKGDRR
jgi:predicted Zn-dependent peptidase